MKEQKILVTAALPYANGKIHLGHLAGAYLPSDIYVRYQRAKGRDVIFICGSDEHGVAITIAAEQEKTTPQEVVDRYHALNKKAFERFGMSFDNYSRTSLPIHHETASEFFLALHASGILHAKEESQFYDEKAKMFLPDRYVEGTCPVCANPEARGDQCERCGTFLNPTELINPRSKITGEKPSVRATTHLYFPLGAFQKRLEEYVAAADKRDGWKENVLQYCRSWFREGLQDRAVTRDLPWGVKVPLPGFEKKVIYVWFDAVLGYISSTREWAAAKGTPERWKEYWTDPSVKYVAFIGKDNVVFHCIVFPAMVMAWNDTKPAVRYVLPENVPANEFLNFEGQKFSKSRGWGIDVDDFLDVFPADALRYALTMILPESRDSDFTWKDFQARTNNELADILGNFVNRTLTFVSRNFGGAVPAAGALTALDGELLSKMRSTPAAVGELIGHYRFRDAAVEAMNLARAANKYFNDAEPWKSLRNDPERCATSINCCVQAVRSLAILFEPIVPAAAHAAWKMLGLDGSPGAAGWDSAAAPALKAGHKIGTPGILVAKIEDEVIARELGKLGGGAAGSSPRIEAPRKGGKEKKVESAGPKPLVTIDDFKKLDLRIARIVAAEPVPKSDKLLKIRVTLGAGEERQVIAGIARHYKPEELVGKSVVVVANLAPAKLMGEESQGMLLAASDTDGRLAILTPAAPIVEGSIVK